MAFLVTFPAITNWMILILTSKSSDSQEQCMMINLFICRNDNDVVARMNVLFDKAMYEKGRSLDTNNNKLVDEKDEGKAIEKAIKESLASGKVGSLSVDPNFLDFEPLGSKNEIRHSRSNLISNRN